MIFTKLQYQLLSELFLDVGKGLILTSFAVPLAFSLGAVVLFSKLLIGAILSIGIALNFKIREEYYDSN